MVIFSLISSLSSCSDRFKKNCLAFFLPTSAVVSVGREKIKKLISLSLPVHPLTQYNKQDQHRLLNVTHAQAAIICLSSYIPCVNKHICTAFRWKLWIPHLHIWRSQTYYTLYENGSLMNILSIYEREGSLAVVNWDFWTTPASITCFLRKSFFFLPRMNTFTAGTVISCSWLIHLDFTSSHNPSALL